MTAPGRFVFDPSRCTGCEACVVACRMANRPAQTRPWRQVLTFNALWLPGLPVYHLSLACHHCQDPACLRHCPADAYRRDVATGAVIHHAERCMGCRYCTWACPHDAPRFDPQAGTVEKCTFCQDRQERGLAPACVAQCPMEALGFERRDGARPDSLPGFPSASLGPAFRLVPGLRPPPETAPALPGPLGWKALLTVPEPRITARGEWTLVAFTSILTMLAALMAAAAAGGRVLPPASPWLIPWAGAVALSLSAWHLGRPDRGWRALGNLRHSWISREAALALAFLGLASLSRIAFPGARALAWAAAATGFAALAAVDRVYQAVARTAPLNLHSAQTLLGGCYLAGLMAGFWPLALAAGGLKAALYLQRKVHFRDRRPLGLVRVLLGFVLPALAFGSGLAVLAAVLGDLADRWEYYGDLQIPSPALELARELRSRGNFG